VSSKPSRPDNRELGERGEDVEEHLAERVGWVVHGATDLQPGSAADDEVCEGTRVGNRPGEPVEPGDDQGVPGMHGCERLVQAGPAGTGPGESFIDVDAAGGDAVPGEGGPLDLGVLGDG
jgi:hypothetical protein